MHNKFLLLLLLKWQMCEKYMSSIHVILCRLSTGKFVLWKLAVSASLHHLSEIFICPLTVLFTLYQGRCLVTFYQMFDVWGSVGYGLGWVGSTKIDPRTTLVQRPTHLIPCALASGALYCNRSCLFACRLVCYNDNSKLRPSILTTNWVCR